MNEKTKFFTAKPSKELDKFISYYYFEKNMVEDNLKEFIYFPHFRNALTIYQNSEVIRKEDYFQINPDKRIKYFISYSTISKSSQQVKILSPFNKIGVVFNPLGINSFIKNTTLSKITERGTHFDYFGIDFEKCLDAVYKEQEIEKKVDVLNSYFTSKIENFQNDIIEKSLELIHSSDEKINVKYISEKLSIHRRTLLREFNKHLCCGVKTYIDVVKFRKAFTWYQTSDIKPNISSLSYDFNYFDQSEFVKHFKKITKSNPTKLLKEIKHLGNEDTYWKVIN